MGSESSDIEGGLERIEEPQLFLARFLEHLPVASQVYALDGQCVLVNRAFRELFGNRPPPEHNILRDDAIDRGGFLDLLPRAFAGEAVRAPAHWYEPRELRRLGVSVAKSVGLEVTLFPIQDRAEAARYIALTAKDVSAELTLRATALELERSEERFRATFEQAAVGIAHVAPDGRWLEVNQRLCDIVGYSREELLQRTFQDITHPDDLGADLELVRQVLSAQRATYSMEKRYIQKDGRLLWVELTVSLVRTATGAPKYFISVVQDISERKQAAVDLARTAHDLAVEIKERTRVERALRESEGNLGTTLNSIGDAVIATDTAGVIVRMNPVAEHLTGWPLAEARGRQLGDVFAISSDGVPRTAQSAVERASSEQAIVGLGTQIVLMARDGTLRPIASSGAPICDARGTEQGIVLVFRDQTSERRAERALRDSEARKSAILEAALDCIVTADQTGTVTEFNPAAERTFGYARAQAIGRRIVDLLVPPSLRERHLDGFRRYLATGEGPVIGKRIEVLALHADGREFPVELAVVPTHSDRTLSFTAYIRDLTERQRSAQALQLSEARFRHLAESGIIGIVVADASGNVHEANDAFLRIIGYSREELAAGKVRWTDLTPPDSRSGIEAATRQLDELGVAGPWEKEYVRKDGTRVPVLVGVAMFDPPRCIAFALDLSGQKRAEASQARALAIALRASEERQRAEEALRQTEEQLRQSQKMEAVGTLAGSIAHDFNNLLSVILGYADIIQQELHKGDPLQGELEQITRAASRANDLTRQLLAFSRQQVLKPSVVNLNSAISTMTRMLRRLIGEDVELVVTSEPELGNAYVDPGQIEQVLLNLIVNARDAMPRGGQLRIETSNARLDAAYATTHIDVVPGDYVRLSVSDTGVGMDRATQSKIFDPFFTTKEKGKGTGLGLATVFGIVKQSGGHICVHSEPGKGATFMIYLPRTNASAETHARNASVPATLRGTESVLLVEDDDQVRTLAASILRKHGYHVIEAANGEEALLTCERFPGLLHVLLTDVVMPRMGGRQLWERLAPLRPEMKVLFMSGYTDDSMVHHGVLSFEFAFIQKPLLPGTLLARLRQVIAEPKPS